VTCPGLYPARAARLRLIEAPMYPEYPYARCINAAAVGSILEDEFGKETVPAFGMTSPALPRTRIAAPGLATATWRVAPTLPYDEVARQIALLVVALLASAATAQEAHRPRVTAGDQWQHVVFHGERSTAPNRTWIVKSVTQDVIEATENGEPLRLTADLNVLESPTRKESNTLALRFPLRVGDGWTYESDTVFKDNGSTARSTVSVKVLAHEKVAVVAGEFEAFRLQASGRFRGLSRGGPGILEGEFTSTYWYAPMVRTIVKSTLTSPYRGTTNVELVAAKLQPSVDPALRDRFRYGLPQRH
jgi:hypothetical protein